ncbi:sugar isomerase domain-containing protein [Biomaibacter acetigenes]|uniref:Sugar isomerase domain-containing protein n=1 Tax=Biomaibacter acetigenes TaxID=2316383 RepID=A0A3G2R8K5_9FIRM|nr:SIS domain-containing protein [Biomaibacter acetigenes]AYO31791.1 sugar isomerase domain-containing protein [Biomaibacter acetigenes]
MQDYIQAIEGFIKEIKETQSENVKKAAEIIAESIMNGGIVHSFGSGHSHAASLEVAGRAGGLIPVKALDEPARGYYETVEGVGTKLMEDYDLRPNDCFIIISNSGRNPLGIEVAQYVKSKGNKVIVVTALEFSKSQTSRHSSGKKLYEFADVILDNKGLSGDAAIEIEGMPVKMGPTSTVTSAVLLNWTVIEATKIMLSKGYTPPVYMSKNVDGGLEYNKKLVAQYADRLFRKPHIKP